MSSQASFRSRTLALVLGGSLLAASGCAILASKSEYAAYRAVRTASDDQARLLAEQAYMAAHPGGQWSKQVQEHRVEAEPAVWEAGKGTRDGLEFYLAAFPDGPHAAQARPRLAALMTVSGRREDEEARRRAVEAQRRAQQEEQRRTWTTRAVSYWTRTLIGLQGWGSPIPVVAQSNPAFSRAFGENPPPRCNADECIKFYRNAYAIPVPGATRIDRVIELVLRLKMPGGNVDRVELLLPNKGFSRWFEMENRTIVTDEDPTQRQQAIDWVVERLGPVLGEAGAAQPTDGLTLDVFAPLAFTSTGEATGTGTPGSGGADAADEPESAPAAPAAPAPAAPEAGSTAPAGGPDTTPTEGAAATSTEGATPSVDDLLAQHSGGDASPATPPPAPPPAAVETPTAPAEAPVPPRAVRVFTTSALRVVVFAAADDDYGAAYDGVYVERNRPAAAPSNAPAGPRRPGAPAGRPGARPRPAR
jgi:hypothetical protein